MIGDSQIQLARSADATTIAGMSREDIEHGLPWRWTPARVERSIADSATNVAIVREGATLAAFGIMKYRDEDAHLLLLAVRPPRRGLGLGSSILDWLEVVARNSGIGVVCAEAREDNAPARAFYRRHGYREVGRVVGMYSGLKDGLRLEKSLRANK